MIRIRTLLAPLGALLLLVPLGRVDAQVVPSPYDFVDTRHEVSVMIQHWNADRGRYGFGPGSGPAISGRYGIHLSGPFALEGHLSVFPTSRHVVEPTEEGPVRIGEADVLMSSLDGRVRFTLTGDRTWRGLAPYVQLGGGIAFDLSGEQSADLELGAAERFSFGPSFLGVAGAGTRWLPGDRIVVQLEGNLGLWRLSTPPGFGEFEDDFGPIEENEWVGSTGISLSVGYRF